MEKQALVVILGDSLLMDGVGSSFCRNEKSRVIHMGDFNSDRAKRLKLLKPQVVIFEMDLQKTPDILSMIQDHPGTVFLGIDLSSCQVIVLNNHRHLIQNMDELYQLAQAEPNYL